MTATEAYSILCKKYSLMRVRACLDFGGFFAFCLAPLYVKDNDAYDVGTCMEAVDKKTGRIFIYDITSDVDAYHKAKPMDVNTIFDMKLKDINNMSRR